MTGTGFQTGPGAVVAAPATAADTPLMAALLRSRLTELSVQGGSTAARGPLDTQRPYLVRYRGAAIGFALVDPHARSDRGTGTAVADFTVLHGMRRRGLGRIAARQILTRHAGAWTLSVMEENRPAVAFWDDVLCAPGIERHPARTEAGVVLHRFHVTPSEVASA